MERGDENLLEKKLVSLESKNRSIVKKVGKVCFYYGVLQLPYIGDIMVRRYVREKKKNGISPLGKIGMSVGEPVFYVWKYGAYGAIIYKLGEKIFS